MAKDPAFLFYPGDWLGGTMLLTRHQKGCYIDLLMAQFNSGPLSLDHIKTVLGQDQATWTVLQEKFKKDNSGKFFNEKLATEIEKRKQYSASRSGNRSGKSKKESHVQSHEKDMKVHMEDVNEDVNEIELKKGGVGENSRDGIVIYNGEKLLEELENSKWLEDLAIHYKIDLWPCLEKLKVFASELKVKNGYSRNLAEIKTHYFNWLNIQLKNKKNDTGKANTKTHAGKGAGSF